ncbi:catechol 1,2-dioxygenase [Pseudohyphozyma bogoriensis]|nr:catechol 1,2-dioxygenase [Pseudohyphozyma bogoriensis]
MSVEDYKKYTDSVIAAIGKDASPRVKEAFPILIQKLHEAVILTGLTTEEWLAACDLLIEAGKVSEKDKRNEMVLVSDVFGIESLVDMMEHAKYAKAGVETTSSAILGPFYRANVPVQPNGTSIIRQPEPEAEFSHVYGTVLNSAGKPIKGAIVDVWHDAPDGLYDSQSPDKPDFHCRGRFETDEDGNYSCIALKPVPYPIPFDHSAGKLLTMMDRHPFRPAHIHFYVTAPGYKYLVTQVYPHDTDYLEDDSVFAVKDDLIVKFGEVDPNVPLPNGGEHDGPIKYQMRCNLILADDKAVDKSQYQG